MANSKLLVTGGSGQVGNALQALIGESGWFPGREELDLANLPDTASLVVRFRTNSLRAIINCAAYTAVDKAESEEALATAINGEAAGKLAESAALLNIPIIQISTDYVFPGDRNGHAWRDDDETKPINAYGRSKLAGELAITASGARHVILRTAWVVSEHGNNFVKTMLRLGKERERVSIVGDQYGCPTSAKDIAIAVMRVANNLDSKPARPSGIYHFVNSGKASWFDLAKFIFDRAEQHGFTSPRLDSIPSSAYPTPAKRPYNSVLSTEKFVREFGIMPRQWQNAVSEVVDDLLGVQLK
jgi:dTDP-4-dehydrorhamnose reductase